MVTPQRLQIHVDGLSHIGL